MFGTFSVFVPCCVMISFNKVLFTRTDCWLLMSESTPLDEYDEWVSLLTMTTPYLRNKQIHYSKACWTINWCDKPVSIKCLSKISAAQLTSWTGKLKETLRHPLNLKPRRVQFSTCSRHMYTLPTYFSKPVNLFKGLVWHRLVFIFLRYEQFMF